jgi:hypothetical protein
MGYDLHLTRRAHWADEEGPTISFAEWEKYVASDAEIQRDPMNQATDFLFVAHPNGPVPLWWSEGEIRTKNPDPPTVQKLVQIAHELSASVQGDDGERYTATP